MITDDITLDSLSTSPDKVLIRRRPRSAATRTLITIFTMPEAPPAPRPAAPAPLLRLTPGLLWAGGGVLGLCYSIACEWREIQVHTVQGVCRCDGGPGAPRLLPSPPPA